MTKTKQFVLMAGDAYYPAGGFNDYQGSYDTKEEAEKAMTDWLNESDYKWAHIADLETGEYWESGNRHKPLSELLRRL